MKVYGKYVDYSLLMNLIAKTFRCDNCKKDVEGIRFDCIHCPSLTYCEKCEQRCTLAHSEELQRQSRPQHVFQLITTPDTSSRRERR